MTVVNVVLYIWMGLAVFLLIGCMWMIFCNHKTHQQRIRFLDRIRDQQNHMALLYQFLLVDYDEHLWTLARFEDARKLYTPDVQEFMRD